MICFKCKGLEHRSFLCPIARRVREVVVDPTPSPPEEVGGGGRRRLDPQCPMIQILFDRKVTNHIYKLRKHAIITMERGALSARKISLML